jgi:hypothetical protein
MEFDPAKPGDAPAELVGAVTVGDTYDEVADSRNQARRQAKNPHASRWVLDHDIRKEEDHDPKPPRQLDLPPTSHANLY